MSENTAASASNAAAQPESASESEGVETFFGGVPGDSGDATQDFNNAVKADEIEPMAEEIELDKGVKAKKADLLKYYKEREAMLEEQKNFKRGVYQKFQELAAQRKALQQFMEHPIVKEVVQADGKLDPDQWAYNRLQKLVEDSQKSPEQKKLEQLEAEKAAWQKQQDEFRQQQEAAQQEQEMNHASNVLQESIIDAFSKVSNLPRTPEMVQRVALKFGNYYNNQDPKHPEEVAKEVYGDFKKEVRAVASKMETAALIEFLGSEIAAKISKVHAENSPAAKEFQNRLKQPKADRNGKGGNWASIQHILDKPQWGQMDIHELKKAGYL